MKVPDYKLALLENCRGSVDYKIKQDDGTYKFKLRLTVFDNMYLEIPVLTCTKKSVSWNSPEYQFYLGDHKYFMTVFGDTFYLNEVEAKKHKKYGMEVYFPNILLKESDYYIQEVQDVIQKYLYEKFSHGHFKAKDCKVDGNIIHICVDGEVYIFETTPDENGWVKSTFGQLDIFLFVDQKKDIFTYKIEK